MYIPIFFNGTQISDLPAYDTLSIDWQLMGAKEIKADIELPGVLACPIGAYIFYNGQQFTVNTVPNVTAGNKYEFKYTITFESDQYRLYDKKLKHLKNKTFQYYGNLTDYAQLVINNINEIDSGWTVGVCDAMPEKTIDFDGHTCRTALDTIAEAFGVEWNLNGKKLSFVKQVGNVTTHVFKRGMGLGLYSLGYQYQDDKNIVTRAFGYGSTRNLPENYRGGATQLMFDGLSLDENVSIYRIKEGDFTSEDIFPKVDGVVSAVSAYDANSSTFRITDSTLAFNLKDNFSSETPKISFLTGELQGQEFEIKDYNNATKTITIAVFVDGSNNKLPNTVFQAQVGDTYTLFDMFLPSQAVTDAEDRLRTATQAWLDENSIPRVVYSLELDPLYARDNSIMLEPGDKVTVVDTALGINSLIRVTSVNYPVAFPSVITPETKIVVQIANFIPYTLSQRVIASTISTKTQVQIVNRTSAEKARLNSLNLRLLQGRIFNPDGSLFTGPASLVAGMAAFGFDSQNFNLNDVIISPNVDGDANKFAISAGQLIHYVYKITGLGYVWNISGNTWSALDPLKFYYVYAKCSTTSLSGTWEISETPVAVNDIPGFYAFNLGILYEVNTDGYRTFQSTKGVTTVVGDQITSGLIQDITGQNYINLTNGKFNMGDATSGVDWDVTTPDTLTIRGAVASKVIKVGSGGVVNARVSGLNDAGSQSIRFAAGPNDEFKVRDDGSLESTKGKIGNWTIDNFGLKNTANVDAYIIQEKTLAGGKKVKASIGTNISTQFFIGEFINETPQTHQNNVGLKIKVTGGTWQAPMVAGLTGNQALDIEGDFVISNGAIMTDGNVGVTQDVGYTRGGTNYVLKFRNGIYVGNYPG